MFRGEQEFRLFEEEEIYGTYPWSAKICYEGDMGLRNAIKNFLIDFIESSLKEPLSKNQLSEIYKKKLKI